MRDLIKVIVWFFVINFSICNHIWTEPVSYWWVIEIIVLIISILMVDKLNFLCYNKYIIKERGAWMMLDLELDLDFGSAENTNELFCVGA